MNLYGRWIRSWEWSLTHRDPNRRILPFEWGLDWIGDGRPNRSDPLAALKDRAHKALTNSFEFFKAGPTCDFDLADDRLTFPSPTPSPVSENNTVHCRVWRTPRARSAVIVVPQWNASVDSHVGLCRVLARMGLTVVRITLPYHETRAPQGMRRADYLVSPNIGRTLHAVRQSVCEVLRLAAWLRDRGYERVGVVGTSLGSCVAYLAFTHDGRIDTGVFNHVSADFADVVWTGLATRFIRWGLEGNIRLVDLRDCWAPLSPWFFIERLKLSERPHLMITARHDLTFLPELSAPVFRKYAELGLSVRRVDLPCGHYTTERFPFKYLDGWHICRYVRRHLL